jgi:hypothetical protein
MVQEIWILWCKKYEISLALRSIDPKQLWVQLYPEVPAIICIKWEGKGTDKLYLAKELSHQYLLCCDM